MKMHQISQISAIVVISAAIVVGIMAISDYYRSFYCLNDTQCITVWKHSSGITYVVPGKYYGLSSPQSTRIETTPHQYFILYFFASNDSTIVVRDDGSSRGFSDFTIINEPESTWRIIEYTDEMRAEVFIEGPARRRDVLPHVNYISLNIREDYATDKYGNRL